MQKLDNTVIKVLDREHGKKVIEWWKSQGVDANNYGGSCTLASGDVCIYYGIINGYFGNFSFDEVLKYNVKIIELPQEKDYSIKGTPLPVIPEGTKYRCSDWSKDSSYDDCFLGEKNHISFGLQEFNGEMHVLHAKKEYSGNNYYMTPLSIIQELDKKEQSKSEPMKTRTITSYQAQSIIDVACETWKNTLFDKWGKAIVLKQEITIDESFYQEMRKACTAPQNELFDKIFGKDFKNPYKVGDHIYTVINGGDCGSHKACKNSLHEGDVDEIIEFDFFENQTVALTKTGAVLRIEKHATAFRLATEEEIKKIKFIPKGTPCLVRDSEHYNWVLAYSNGDGKFANSGNGYIHSWKQVQVLDINNLPK
jgi:hypothetical protein